MLLATTGYLWVLDTYLQNIENFRWSTRVFCLKNHMWKIAGKVSCQHQTFFWGAVFCYHINSRILSGKKGLQHLHPNFISGQIIIFHQPRFPWNKGISLTKPPFGVRSCEVAIIWPVISLFSFIFCGGNKLSQLPNATCRTKWLNPHCSRLVFFVVVKFC